MLEDASNVRRSRASNSVYRKHGGEQRLGFTNRRRIPCCWLPTVVPRLACEVQFCETSLTRLQQNSSLLLHPCQSIGANVVASGRVSMQGFFYRGQNASSPLHKRIGLGHQLAGFGIITGLKIEAPSAHLGSIEETRCGSSTFSVECGDLWTALEGKGLGLAARKHRLLRKLNGAWRWFRTQRIH